MGAADDLAGRAEGEHDALPGFGQAGWIRWQRGRVACLRADEEGHLTLFPLRFRGRRMILNYRTRARGFIKVRVQGSRMCRTIEECDMLAGDELDRVVTWRGESDLLHAPDEPVQLSLRLANADVFSVRFEQQKHALRGRMRAGNETHPSFEQARFYPRSPSVNAVSACANSV